MKSITAKTVKNGRNINIESLRVAMMLLIVIMHLSGGSVDMGGGIFIILP